MRKIIYPLLAVLFLPAFLDFGSDTPPDIDPNTRISSELYGYSVLGHTSHGPVAIDHRDQGHWVTGLVTGYDDEHRLDDIRVENNALETIDQCWFHWDKGERDLHAVYLRYSSRSVNLSSYSHGVVRHRAKKFVKDYQSIGVEPEISEDSYRHTFKLGNVYINEADRPIDLVLISDHMPILWNLQLAPDAKIANIFIVAPAKTANADLGAAGIVNAPEDTKVRVIDGDALRHCEIEPARQPRHYWTLLKKDHTGQYTSPWLVREKEDLANVFEHWFDVNFGQSLESSLIGSSTGSHFFIGRRPSLDERLAYEPISGKSIRTTKLDYVVYGDEDDLHEDLSQMVKQEARRLLGADLTVLRR